MKLVKMLMTDYRTILSRFLMEKMQLKVLYNDVMLYRIVML